MELPALVLLGALAFAWTTWAALLWGSIKLVQRDNPSNRFGMALVLSAVEVCVAVVMGYVQIFGLILLVLWLVVLLRLLLAHYELGLLPALGVVIVTVVGPYFVAGALVTFLGKSPALILIALYAVPIGVLAVWLRSRGRRAPVAGLPEARVEKRGRRGRAPAREAAPPAAAPPVIAPPIAAPAAPAAPRADGDPAFLR
jgi:hypothetical protein